MIEKNAKLKWRRIYWNGKGYDMSEETKIDPEEDAIVYFKRARNITVPPEDNKTPTIEIQTLQDERRDLFAAAALTGLLSAVDAGEAWVSHCSAAEDSFRYADAMIAASKKGDD